MLIFAVFFGFYAHSFRLGISLELGGLCGVLANLYFAWRFLKRMDACAPHKIMRAMILGELSKLALSGASVILLILFTRMNPLAVIAGFVIAQFGFWLAPVLDRKEPRA